MKGLILAMKFDENTKITNIKGKEDCLEVLKYVSKRTSLIVFQTVNFDITNSSDKCSPTSLYDIIEARSNILIISSFVMRFDLGICNLLSNR